MKDFFELRLVVFMDREEILWLLMSSGLAIEFENVQFSDLNVVLGLIDPNDNLLSFNDDLLLGCKPTQNWSFTKVI